MGCLAFVVALVIVVGGVILAIRRLESHEPLIPESQHCVATASGTSVSMSLSQAHYAAVIAGVSVRRGLAPRAASIALTTAYQESNLRNLDHGDRDSIGLFQQRPSMGWGTKKQLMDPYYATGRFYDALVRVHGWQSGDINDVAQEVQRSGFPEAYRDHEQSGRILASVLTGHSPGGLTCLERKDAAGDPGALVASVRKTLGVTKASVSGSQVVFRAPSGSVAWAVAQHAVANSGEFGVAQVTVGDSSWHHDPNTLPVWATTKQKAAADEVIVLLR